MLLKQISMKHMGEVKTAGAFHKNFQEVRLLRNTYSL